jgi:hypothetical protein
MPTDKNRRPETTETQVTHAISLCVLDIRMCGRKAKFGLSPWLSTAKLDLVVINVVVVVEAAAPRPMCVRAGSASRLARVFAGVISRIRQAQ